MTRTPAKGADSGMHRRGFLAGSGAVAGATLLGGTFWRAAFTAAAVDGPGPYGVLAAAPDASGLRLPAGFTSRILATTGLAVAPGDYLWHAAPDGGACFPTADGGWIYVSSAEVPSDGGGVGAIRFAADATVVDSYAVLTGTSRNCSGGVTPWRTYLSCEEVAAGQVYECDPHRSGVSALRAGLGTFNHEAAVVDPATGDVYLTEDDPVGRLYRFVPTRPGDLSEGVLYAASLSGTTVTWVPTSPDAPDRQSTTSGFAGGEGMYMGDGVVYFVTKSDQKVWELNPSTSQLVVIHDASAAPADTLDAVDAITLHHLSGDLFVSEDGGNMQVGVIGYVGGERQVAPFLQIDGHDGSEVTGLAFSPDGTRLYLSSQRGADGVTAVTYEVTGPFRRLTGRAAVDRDTFVRAGRFEDTNYGTARELQVASGEPAEVNRWAYLAVDTAAFDPPVGSARLRVHASVGDQPPAAMVVAATTADWDEAAVTAASAPEVGETLGEVTVRRGAGRFYEIDVTPHVTRARAGGQDRVGFALRQPVAGSVMRIRSRESRARRPQLVLEPLTYPEAHAVATPARADAHVRDGNFATRNFGGSRRLQLRTATVPGQTRWVYLRFDTAFFLPEVDDAVLVVGGRGRDDQPQTLDVHATASDWDESAITWDTKPMRGRRIASAEVALDIVGRASVRWDLTEYVVAARAAGRTTIGVLVRARRPGSLLELDARSVAETGPALLLRAAR